ncbi:coiled-coil domain-containing protein 115 [Marchantia polymorpha subsp. ruderalis]|uniref:Vacuolar ATPase assembly protein VMA22 n=2 Tax=Marchantia polymorpha TaxID=3197 RepID=A0AAF6BFK5_MARPO|nr:hypothetical protein MARPO_0189s0009 [Marchantia polymorpha]BBN10789.1 hypothetical protein Mp_5g06450 [Marchantia polymorpha subsp. ruderalis]|eukprot:PTQ27635.1 hypothetical protein MARPO_0189s0009 [Marchantia polymorpha]
MVEAGSMREGTGNLEQLDKEVLQCLDSVHLLLERREILHQTLRQGWMELTSARYTMGPARISSPLFSLKPHAPSAVVDVRGAHVDSTEKIGVPELEEEIAQVVITGPVAFHLVRNREEKEEKPSVTKLSDLTISEKKNPAKLRRRLTSTASEIEQDERKDRWEIKNLTDDSATESDDELTIAEGSKDTTQPLHWFGALVSPHLRSAQSNFSKALDIVVELLNAQSEAAHAHGNVMSLRRAATEN